MKNPKDFAEIQQRIQTGENWRDSQFIPLWQDCYRQYRSRRKEPKEGNKPQEVGRSSVYVPYTFMQVEVIKARLVESLFNSRPYISVLPRESNDEQMAEHVQSLLSWQFDDRMGLERVFSEHLLADITIFGTAISYTGWLVRKRKTKHRTRVERPLEYMDGLPALQEDKTPVIMPFIEVVEEDELVYDDPVVQKIDLFDFFVDPAATNIADARY